MSFPLLQHVFIVMDFVRYILKHAGVKQKLRLEINIYERQFSERCFPA